MNRKAIFTVLLVMGAIGLIITNTYSAPMYGRSGDSRILTYTLVKTTALTTSTAVTANNNIIGYMFCDLAVTGGEAALYDAGTSTAPNSSTLFAEPLVEPASNGVYIIYPMPRKLSNGLTVKMSTTSGTLTVFYE